MLKRLKHLALALALLLAPADAFAQSSKLSNLTAGGAVSGTDLFYDVQSVGVGGVKVTGTQLLTFVLTPPVNVPLGSIAANTLGVNITGTFNNAAVVFDAPLFENIINTASATGSLLMDLQVGGSSQFKVDKVGAVTAATSFNTSNTTVGGAFVFTQGSATAFMNGSPNAAAAATVAGLGLSTNASLAWSTGANGATSEVALFRDAAVGVVAIGDFASNGTATGLRVYNTTDNVGTNTAPTNFERFAIDFTTTANTVTIGPQAGGTGLIRNVNLVGTLAQWNWTSLGINFTGFTINLNGGAVIATGSGPASVTANTTSFAQLAGATGAAGVSIGSGQFYAFSNTNNSVSTDTTMARAAAKVVEFGDTAANTNGWFQWQGEARLDADFSATSNTTLANVTGTTHSLTVNLQAARNYIFEISLPMVTGATAGGIKIALGGTATVTNLIVDGFCNDGPASVLINTTRVAALATNIVANTNAGTTPKCTLWGTFEVLAAGTFTTQFAQNASNATASTVKRGAYMFVNDAP